MRTREDMGAGKLGLWATGLMVAALGCATTPQPDMKGVSMVSPPAAVEGAPPPAPAVSGEQQPAETQQAEAPDYSGAAQEPDGLKAVLSPEEQARLEQRRSKRDQAFTPVPIHHRAFRVLINGEAVGYAGSHVEQWHMGHTLVTHFDRYLFAQPKRKSGFAMQSEVRHSETEGRPNAWFGHGSTGHQAFRFRLSGSGPSEFEGQWFGGVRSKKRIPAPKDGYVLCSRLWSSLLQLAAGGEAVRAAVNVYAWQAESREWRTLIWELQGREPVEVEGGATENATRWQVTESGCSGVSALVWLDRDGHIVKKAVPALHLEILPYATEELARAAPMVSWDQAGQRWGLSGNDWVERELLAHFQQAAEPGDTSHQAEVCYPAALLSLWCF